MTTARTPSGSGSTAGGQAWSSAVTVAGPVVLGLVVALIGASSNLGGFGPFDRATTGWVVLPVALVSPFLAGLAGRRVVDWTALGFGLVMAAWTLAIWVPGAQLACRPTTDRLEFLVPALAVGMASGLASLVAGLVAAGVLPQGRIRALAASMVVAAFGGLGILVTYLVAFPVVSCAWVP